MRDNMTSPRAVLLPRQCWMLPMRLCRPTTHKKRLLGIAHSSALLAVVLSLIVPATASWEEKVLYSFQGGANDGFVPAGGVVFDPQGNLYGATTDGGPATCKPIGGACGTVFQLSPPAQKAGAWTETLIYQFQGKGSNDASVPNGGLIRDAAGNLYGITAYGGTGNCVLLGVPAGCGAVYELSPPKQKGGAWTETILYSFPTAKQGYLPNGDLVFDSAGNLYGATVFGGGKGTTCDKFYQYCGAVFKLSPPKTKGGKWTEKVLHAFRSGTDGASPNGGLVLDGKGNVYGTTLGGGNEGGECGSSGCGTVFKLVSPGTKGTHWTEDVLDRFNPGISGAAQPAAGVIFDRSGRLYGTTIGGGNSGSGTVFQIAPRSDGKWVERVLYRFRDGDDGSKPRSVLVFDSKGTIYGTATSGGSNFAGTLLQLAKDSSGRWAFAAVYSFHGVNNGDGAFPSGDIVLNAGNIFIGTTAVGGTGSSCQGGCGTVFEVMP
jgi:uncharacterized repeat protein (TIGR03803 family)